MNLALLDPFRRQLPDRIDCTLSLPSFYHQKPQQQQQKNSDDEPDTEAVVRDNDSTAIVAQEGEDEEDDTMISSSCLFTMYNRRGTYLSVGHASGAVAIFDSTARTLVALYYYYYNTAAAATTNGKNSSNNASSTTKPDTKICSSFITCTSWSRKGTVLWISSKFHSLIQRIDLTHPNPDYYILNHSKCNNNVFHSTKQNAASTSATRTKVETSPGVIAHLALMITDDNSNSNNNNNNNNNHAPNQNNNVGESSTVQGCNSTSNDSIKNLTNNELEGGKATNSTNNDHQSNAQHNSKKRIKTAVSSNRINSRFQAQVVQLPMPVNSKTGCVAHPRDDNISMANLSDGSLALLYFPPFTLATDDDDDDDESNSNAVRLMYIVLPFSEHFVNCATFDRTGRYIFAITSCGILLGFELKATMIGCSTNNTPYVSSLVFEYSLTSQCSKNEQDRRTETTTTNKNNTKSLVQTYEIISSRHGNLIAVNCFTDGTLKIYDMKMLLQQHQQQQPTDLVMKPRHVFSDPVNKSLFVSCDFSGDGEYIVGGKNNHLSDDKYELYIWNTTTGVLLDRLTGPQTTLHNLAWHPNRSLLAAATGDGLVDIWGPRIDWTAFAPDFQALPSNIEYVEQEDEFDIVVDEGSGVAVLDATKDDEEEDEENEEVLDVVTVEHIPVFESDSEDDVFCFPTSVKCLVNRREKKGESQVK